MSVWGSPGWLGRGGLETRASRYDSRLDHRPGRDGPQTADRRLQTADHSSAVCENALNDIKGYDTALNTAVNAIDKIRDTASSHNRLFFIEVMGKGSGHIALNAGIGAGAEEVLIPEQSMGLDRLLDSLKKSEKSGKSSSIIVVSEGDKIGDNVFSFSSYIEKNLPHYEIRVSILGHIQRGGTPSCFDRVLASRMGVYAVDCLIEQKSKIMVGIIDDKMVTIPISKAIKGGQSLDDDLVRVCDIISI